MSALTCDICGGNLAMNESGDFAVCESCGMKHTKERVKVKVQEIKGVVEITKGEAEKERLLKNAETFIKINDVNKAEEIYEQLMADYPDDETAYVEYLKLLFPRLSAELSRSEYAKLAKPWSPYSDIKRIVAIIENLSDSKYDNLIDSLWLEHDKKHLNFESELIRKYNAGEISLYSEISGSKSAYAPLFENAQCQAKKLINLLNGIDPSILLGKFKIKYAKVDVDGFVLPSKIQTIKYVTPKEIICSCLGYFLNDPPSTFDFVCIEFGRPMSIEEIAQIIIDNYQKNSEAQHLITCIYDHESALRGIITKFTDNKIRTSKFNWETNFSYRITKINTRSLEYVVSYKSSGRQESETKKVIFNCNANFDEILVVLRKHGNKCIHCGGDFKGLFTKVCTECGKPKDY